MKPPRLKGDRTPLGIYAEIEAKRFMRDRDSHANRLWFKPYAAFAVEISNGTVSAAPIEADPAMDVVAKFYNALDEEDHRRWTAQFGVDGTYRERAASVDLKPSGLHKWKDNLMEQLGRRFAEVMGGN
jgi:hypothetical protein